MSEGTSVGKISLGIEFVGLDEKIKALSKDLSHKLGNIGGIDFDKVSESLEKSLKSVADSFQTNMEKVSMNISRTLTDALGAVKKKAESIEISMPKVNDNTLPLSENLSTPSNRSNAPPSAAPSRTKTDPLLTAQSNLEIVAKQMDMLASKADVARDKVKQIEAEIKKMSMPSGNPIEDSINSDAISKLKIELDKASSALDGHVLKVDKAAAQYNLLEDAIKKIQADQIEKANQNTQKLADQAKKAADKLKDVSNSTTNLGKVSDNVSNKFNKMGKMITQALKRVLIMATLYKVIRGFMNYMNSALKTNEQFNASLAQIKSNLQVAFMPIFQAILPAINALMSGLARVTSYLAAFMSAIFGKSFKKSADAANALNKQKDAIAGVGGAAKKAKKEADLMLAGFDEITNLSSPKADDSGGGGGGGGGGGVTGSAPIIEPPNISEIEGIIDKFINSTKEKLSGVWNSEPVQAFVGSVTSKFTFLKEFASTTFANIKENAVQTFNRIAPEVQGGFNNLSALMTNVFNDYSTTLDKYGPIITDKFNGLITSIWQDVVDPGAIIISGIWNDMTGDLKELWDKHGKQTLENIGEFITKTIGLFQKLWDNIIEPIVMPLLKTFKKIWDEHLRDTLKNVWEFIIELANGAMEIYNKFIAPVIGWLSEKFKPIIEWVMAGVAGFIEVTVGGMLKTFNGIITALRGVVQFLVGVFTGDWERAWGGIKTIFKGVFDSLKAIALTPINLIINALNTLIRGLNKIDIKFPDWVLGLGGKGLNVNIPTIPMLAKGGIIDQPRLAMIGEAGKEAVVPLERNTEWIDMLASKISAASAGSKQEMSGDIVFELDGEVIGRIAKKHINKERRMKGIPVLE